MSNRWLLKKHAFNRKWSIFPAIAILLLVKWGIFSNHVHIEHSSFSDQPFVFIGGHPRSGTTLMRVLLDVHPKIRCGPETGIIPKFLSHLHRIRSGSENLRLRKANLYPTAIYSAFRNFISTLIRGAGPIAPILCNKDPLSFVHLQLLSELFPQAKFINMVRDGRAVVASLLKRKVTMSSKNLTTFELLERWQNITWKMLHQCESLGPIYCRTVYYEQLVLKPQETLRSIFDFLAVEWDPIVLHHETYINTTIINSLEPSSTQVKYALHLDALAAWAGNTSVLDAHFRNTAHSHSWLLSHLGYSRLSIPPNYGVADPLVEQNTKRLQQTDLDFIKLYS